MMAACESLAERARKMDERADCDEVYLPPPDQDCGERMMLEYLRGIAEGFRRARRELLAMLATEGSKPDRERAGMLLWADSRAGGGR